jgi:hypothetical protein
MPEHETYKASQKLESGLHSKNFVNRDLKVGFQGYIRGLVIMGSVSRRDIIPSDAKCAASKYCFRKSVSIFKLE